MKEQKDWIIVISVIVGIITVIVAYMQYKDQKKIRDVEFELKKIELNKAKGLNG